MIHSSDSTASSEFEQIRRDGLLARLAHAPPTTVGEPVTAEPSTPLETGSLDAIADIPDPREWLRPMVAQSTHPHRDTTLLAADFALAATQPDQIAAALSLGGCRAIAERIRDLNEISRDDALDEPTMVLASLRELALFFLSQRRLVDPEIGLSPDGLLLAEWASAERDVLAMKFRPDGIIQFAAVSAAGSAGPRLRINGELPKHRALDAVQAFIPRFNSLRARDADAA